MFSQRLDPSGYTSWVITYQWWSHCRQRERRAPVVRGVRGRAAEDRCFWGCGEHHNLLWWQVCPVFQSHQWKCPKQWPNRMSQKSEEYGSAVKCSVLHSTALTLRTLLLLKVTLTVKLYFTLLAVYCPEAYKPKQSTTQHAAWARPFCGLVRAFSSSVCWT